MANLQKDSILASPDVFCAEFYSFGRRSAYSHLSSFPRTRGITLRSPIKHKLRLTKGDEINVCAERERERQRDGENKRKLPPQHKFTVMLGDKRGVRCN